MSQMNRTELEAVIHRVETGLLPNPQLWSAVPVPATLTERMAFYRTPGVSVAVIREGRVEWAKGYGTREDGRDLPVGPRTMFQAASISKPVAGLAALRLASEGRLDLDEPIDSYLTSWRIPDGDGWRPRVTIRHILSHSSGLSVHGFPGYRRRGPRPTVKQILDGDPPANTAAVRPVILPGTQWLYSGGAFTVLQVILEDVTGLPFPRLMKELVLDPLGMADSTYEQPLPESRWEQAAMGHYFSGSPLVGGFHVYPEMAAAGLWTTPTDLAKMAAGLVRAAGGETHPFLAPWVVREMLTSQYEGIMGLGFFVEGEGESASFRHSGDNAGYKAMLVAHPARRSGAVVMTNADGSEELRKEVLRAIAREYGWPVNWFGALPPRPSEGSADADARRACAGDYELKAGRRMAIRVAPNGLTLTVDGQPPLALHPESDWRYFSEELNLEVVFLRDDRGRVTGLRLVQEREIEARRLDGNAMAD